MLAWEIAKQWQSANCMTPFEELLGAYLSSGLAHSTPSVFLLAQECHWTGMEMISRQEAKAQSLPINSWFVELAAAGTFSRRGAEPQRNPVKEFMRVATRPHEFVLWYRQSQGRPHNLHAYRWDHLARRVGQAQ
jgi:hypothetical protein